MDALTFSNTLCRWIAAPLALALAGGGCSDDGSKATDTVATATTTGDTDPGTTTEVAPTTSGTETTVAPTSTGGETTDTGTTGATETTDTTETTGATETTDATETTEGVTSTGVETTDATETTGGEEIVKVQIVAFNDFHGNLEPPSGSGGKIILPDDSKIDAGGAAFLATHVAALRADNPNTLVVSAGDLVGASPLTSALFHDEPTIEVMNQIGLDFNAVGNHEFDEGATELLRMQSGGCHPVDGCADGTPFPGAAFQFLAANVLVDDKPGETLLPSHAVRDVDGVRIGFIGLTLAATASIVTPSGIAGLTFADEIERINAVVPELTGIGVEAIVVLIHEGGFQPGYYDECAGISGPIVDIVSGIDDAVDVVVTGHTHQAYNCVVAGKVVTSAASFGRVLTDIDLEISTATGDVTAVMARNVVVTRDEADPFVESFVADYKELSAPLANQQIGTITAALAQYAPVDGPGLSEMGAVLADAHLAATADPLLGGAQIAFMNPGGVRDDLTYLASGDEPVDGIVTYGEAFSVQPFGNNLVVMSLTGLQIDALLEQQFSPGLDPNILQVSSGFNYTYSLSAPIGSKIDPASITLDGVALAPEGEYRVAVISYLASGGDSFSVFVDGTDVVGGVTDMDALQMYFAAYSPVSPPTLDRITAAP